MKTKFFLLLSASSAFTQAPNLDKAPLLDAPGPGYRQEPHFTEKALSGHPDEAASPVELRMRGKQITLPKSASHQLSQQAVHLVESSNFHFGPGDKYHFFTLSGVQNDYRREVAGNFLLVSFPTPRKVKTVGGEITVAEIVVGLNRDDYASSLFTIDDSGRIIGHSKYAGELCIQIFDTVKQLPQ